MCPLHAQDLLVRYITSQSIINLQTRNQRPHLGFGPELKMQGSGAPLLKGGCNDEFAPPPPFFFRVDKLLGIIFSLKLYYTQP